MDAPNAVRVLARRESGTPGGPLPLIFGQMVNVNNANVTRTATAVIGGVIHAGIVLLNPHGIAIDMRGTGNVDKVSVPNGAIQVNSDSNNAIKWNGNANIDAEELYIGGNQTNVQGEFTVDHVGINSPPVPDPLAGSPIPPQGTDRTGVTGSPLPPGYYPNGLPLVNQRDDRSQRGDLLHSRRDRHRLAGDTRRDRRLYDLSRNRRHQHQCQR